MVIYRIVDLLWSQDVHRIGSQDFLEGRDVFERLYRDALRRMRTQAEVQARLAEERVSYF